MPKPLLVCLLQIKNYLVPAESESDDQKGQVVANFQLGQSYNVGRDDRLRQRHLQREASQLNAIANEQEALEEAIAAEIEHPDAAVAAALQIAEEDHQAAIGLQTAQAKINAQRQAEANQHLEEQQAAESTLADDEGFALPSDESENETSKSEPAQQPDWSPQPKPKRLLKKRFVNRNGVWLRTKRLKRFHVGEKVWVRNSAGDFEVIGKVNKNGMLPAAFVGD